MQIIFQWHFALMSLITVLPVIFWIKHRQNLWKRLGIYQVKPKFFFGNLEGFFLRKKAFGECFKDIYDEIKVKDGMHGGIYSILNPIYVPVDLATIKQITVKDFHCFMNHGNYYDEKNDPLTAHLFNLEGDRWRSLRAKLSPTFTSGKIKNMHKTFLDCTENLKEIVLKSCLEKKAIDVKEIMSRYTIDIIGNCVFGVECNSLANANSEFHIMGRKIFDFNLRISLSRIATNLLPKKICLFLGVKTINPGVENFFINVIKNTVEHRENTQYQRQDFMHLLLQLKNQGKLSNENNISQQETSHLTFNELAAQCFLFFFAGFETSATTMTYALFELAQNQDVQDKLRIEIRTYWEQYDSSYEAIMNMSYLDKVICETLRKYPPVPCTNRMTNDDYKIPNSNLIVRKGTNVAIPILGLHMDPEYYPDPERFDPERFSEEVKALRPGCTWMPFGEGPRICLGARFGLVQIKTGVALMIKHFKVSLNASTKLPLEMDPCTMIYASKGDILLDFENV